MLGTTTGAYILCLSDKMINAFTDVFLMACRSEVTSTPGSFGSPPSLNVSSALVRSGWIMPLPVIESSAGTVSQYPSYPAGMSLDHAAIEPLSGILLFYVPTMVDASTYLNLLYYIQPDPRHDERLSQPVLLESPNSAYAEKSMSAVATVYTTAYAPTLLFMLYAGLYVRYDWVSGAFHPLGSCLACPQGRTSLPGAQSVYECYCQVCCSHA